MTIDGHRIVHELSLAADSGEVVGLIGPNGSGKSTALRCVYRALKPSGGVMRVGGEDVATLTARAAAKRVAVQTQEWLKGSSTPSR